MNKVNWHDQHTATVRASDRTADAVANGMGSWRFTILQSVFIVIRMALNILGLNNHRNASPFILLNLIFLTQEAYAAPIIMM